MRDIQQEQENREMLERFRSAHISAEERELKLQQAEGLNNSIKLELLSSDTERRHLREKLSLQDREIQEVMRMCIFQYLCLDMNFSSNGDSGYNRNKEISLYCILW